MSLAAQRFLRPSRLPFRHFGLCALSGQRTDCPLAAHPLSSRTTSPAASTIRLRRRVRLSYTPHDAMRGRASRA
jgi:hypothetical protein